MGILLALNEPLRRVIRGIRSTPCASQQALHRPLSIQPANCRCIFPYTDCFFSELDGYRPFWLRRCWLADNESVASNRVRELPC